MYTWILKAIFSSGVIIGLYVYFLYALCLFQIIYAEVLLYHHQKWKTKKPQTLTIPSYKITKNYSRKCELTLTSA